MRHCSVEGCEKLTRWAGCCTAHWKSSIQAKLFQREFAKSKDVRTHNEEEAFAKLIGNSVIEEHCGQGPKGGCEGIQAVRDLMYGLEVGSDRSAE